MQLRREAAWTLALVLLVACAGAGTDDTAADADAAAEVAPQTATPPADRAADPVALACAPNTDRSPLEGRASPYDSSLVTVGNAQAKICYNRPSARGRTMLGGELPYGTLWRTGANEPTTIHLPVAARIAGIAVEPGSYSIYTIPGEREWTIIVNRSISQWGADDYTEVEAQEVGRSTVPSQATSEHIEQFTIRAEPGGQATSLILEWENTRVAIPIAPV
jgi:hypothetical protein